VAGGQAAYSRAGEVALALTVPCAVALMVIPEPMISTLFERGRFTASDSAATALAVAIYGLGLPAFVLQKIFQPLYFAREDTKRPFYFALASMVINAVVAVGLWSWLDYLAAALATTAAGWAMAWLLWYYARDFGQAAQFDARFKRTAPRIIAASVLMGVGLYFGHMALAPLFEMGAWRYLALAILLIGGGVLYGLLGRALGAFTPGELKASLRRSGS